MLSPFRIGGDSLFEFSGGPPSQGHSAHFTPIASPFISLSVLKLVPHALAVICGLEYGRGEQGFHVVDVTNLSRRRKQWSPGVGLNEDILPEHRNFGAYPKDALHRQSVCMIFVTASKCLLC